MKLGILVVYFVSPDNDWVIKKQLDHFAKSVPFMDFTVYASANRLSSEYKDILRSYEFVEIVDLPIISERGSAEHGTYLDMLAAYAVSKGCDFISTFDVDSWPIDNDWIRISYEKLVANKTKALAILRAENGDTVLAHPSFTFVEAELFKNSDCRYWVPEENRSTEFSRYFAKHNQFCDTGASLAYFFHNNRIGWTKILRSNAVNYHYLMAGIYDDFIFHVGASSRNDLIFRKEDAPWTSTLSRPIASIPFFWRFAPKFQNLLRSTYEPAIKRRNRDAFILISNSINADEAKFYDQLRGQ